jgi:hypothetical protein
MNEKKRTNYRLAKVLFAAFISTVIASRVLVYLIMTHRVPSMYLHVGGNHIHHLNYGIFLLAAIGGYLLFASPNERRRAPIAVIYGVAMGLTFDEFGMWLHLDGDYWQQASWNAVGMLTALLGFVAFAPCLQSFTIVRTKRKSQAL